MDSLVRGRANGDVLIRAMQPTVSARVLRSLALSETTRMARVHTLPVHSLAIDRALNRFMLSAGADTSIQLYDLDCSETAVACAKQIAPKQQVPSGAGHTRLVTSIEWYFADCGMFSTGSFDNTLRVWDASNMTEACRFDLEARVNRHQMSTTGAHMLIAVADESEHVRLCDLASGAFAQSLPVHGQGTNAVAWSPTEPYVLATGGNDGSLKLWDIRQADSQLQHFSAPSGPNARNQSPVRSGTQHAGSLDKKVGDMFFVKDGAHLVSIGIDHRLQKWLIAGSQSALLFDLQISVSSSSSMVNAGSAKSLQATYTSASDELTAGSEVAFIPNGDTTVAVIDIANGTQMALLDGHLSQTLCAAWRPGHLELFTGGADGNILKWCPPAREMLSEAQKRAQKDTWSEDES
ncbi:DNA excision repair protein ERCC-8 [Coemansia erecta]|uniref:DNA excision repair protein ERCC-8 n=1 Tax=Coemansia asiatica TaxID=1052880 RepID=A0A9W8CLZ8_9FUNG|nr:DNA excision repair protein ERCC-8 [Coemansia asiatica]KAJ2854969.1 DNA excision repair protein ERCC-8 [Coemansia erecta]KAJ2888424.1 DNA excision repair protein ERCC-8 [Coemansia asiatica]